MGITKEDLSDIVSKYVLIHDYISTKHPNAYIFHLNNDYEIAISVGESEREFYKIVSDEILKQIYSQPNRSTTLMP